MLKIFGTAQFLRIGTANKVCIKRPLQPLQSLTTINYCINRRSEHLNSPRKGQGSTTRCKGAFQFNDSHVVSQEKIFSFESIWSCRLDESHVLHRLVLLTRLSAGGDSNNSRSKNGRFRWNWRESASQNCRLEREYRLSWIGEDRGPLQRCGWFKSLII